MGARTSRPSVVNDPDFEQLRQVTLRCWTITLRGGKTDEVWAHWLDVVGDTGILRFITVDPDGNQRVHDGYSPGLWRRYHEVTGGVPMLRRDLIDPKHLPKTPANTEPTPKRRARDVVAGDAQEPVKPKKHYTEH
jgi:hypothetical protein